MASLDRLASRLKIDLVASQAQLYDGSAIAAALGRSPWQRGLLTVDPARPALVLAVTGATVELVTRFLVDSFGTDADCHLLDTAVDAEPPLVADLGQLRSLVGGDSEAAVWVQAADPYLAGRSAETLSRIIARLRAPGGCPWDREQTSQSLRDDIAGEAWEVMDAVDNGDDRNLAEELGDVLMAVALQAQIAEDEGRFTLADIYEGVNAKLVRRHPHVFGEVTVSGTDDIVANWNRIKADEKAQTGQKPTSADDPLARYPASMPTTVLIERMLASRQLVFGGGKMRHPDPERSTEQDRFTIDRFIGWYASRRSAGYDTEAEMRDILRTYFANDAEPRYHAD